MLMLCLQYILGGACRARVLLKLSHKFKNPKQAEKEYSKSSEPIVIDVSPCDDEPRQLSLNSNMSHLSSHSIVSSSSLGKIIHVV